MPGGLAQGLGQQGRRRPGPLIPGMEVRTWHMRVGARQGLDLGGDIGSLVVQGDELPGQVR